MRGKSENIENSVVLAKNKTLYHGSETPGMREFQVAEEDTIGIGVYFTTEEAAARGYALRRARSRKGIPVVYEANVDGARLVDLRDKKTLDQIFERFGEVLQEKLQRTSNFWLQKKLQESLEKIREKVYSPRSIRDVTWSHCNLFTNHLQSLGYDGLISIEGGEGNIGNHETWLIFDPLKPKITKEMIIQ